MDCGRWGDKIPGKGIVNSSGGLPRCLGGAVARRRPYPERSLCGAICHLVACIRGHARWGRSVVRPAIRRRAWSAGLAPRGRLVYSSQAARLAAATCGDGERTMDKHDIAEREDSVAERPPVLESCGNGVWRAPGARIIDLNGPQDAPYRPRQLRAEPLKATVVVDKTMLIADVLDSGYTVTPFRRPRRFGKTLNMTMMRAFFEMPNPSSHQRPAIVRRSLREPKDLGGGRRPLPRLSRCISGWSTASSNTVKKLDWETAYAAIRNVIAAGVRAPCVSCRVACTGRGRATALYHHARGRCHRRRLP